MNTHHTSTHPSPSPFQNDGHHRTYGQHQPLNPTTPAPPARGNDAWAWEIAHDSRQNRFPNVAPFTYVPTIKLVTIPIVSYSQPQPQSSPRFTVDDTGFPLERGSSFARTESPNIHSIYYAPPRHTQYSEPNVTIPPPGPPPPTLASLSPPPTTTNPLPPPIYPQWPSPPAVPVFVPVFPVWSIPPPQPTPGLRLPSFPSNGHASPDCLRPGLVNLRSRMPAHRDQTCTIIETAPGVEESGTAEMHLSVHLDSLLGETFEFRSSLEL
ncbi:hypothetical protein PHLGIDRAFT_128631 [Phlebiopsis gigantea 11061_1 CR5-6]|uniref:Uncharacterized protein n=1 Tax=Phlebiopsis gigantea (strain 11061_1 CR5-6) TaxID=745531 RepID=A0A0C3S5X5_PHLG1|nr:hypothetical protein PHLGIDRAFT_128631 [Phlebiopsis gigantea 11061_1 CR5-6]